MYSQLSLSTLAARIHVTTISSEGRGAVGRKGRRSVLPTPRSDLHDTNYHFLSDTDMEKQLIITVNNQLSTSNELGNNPSHPRSPIVSQHGTRVALLVSEAIGDIGDHPY